MGWAKEADKIIFECDSCEAEGTSCDIAEIRRTSAKPDATDYIVCFSYMQGVGWRAFKRTGRPWTYHCPVCGPQAEITHRDYMRLERAREVERARDGG